jgi:hypothetical protein
MDAGGARHFAMHDAAARGHELDVARTETPLAPGMVGVDYLAGDDKGHRLDAAVRVGRETGRRREPVLGHHEERAVLGDAHGRDGHPRAMAGTARLWRAGALNGPDRKLHERSS